jgi:hypothetical protein
MGDVTKPAEPAEGLRSVRASAADLAKPAAKRRPPHDEEAVRRAFETGEYPYASRLSEREYEERVLPLQVELLEQRPIALTRCAGQPIGHRLLWKHDFLGSVDIYRQAMIAAATQMAAP